MSVKVPPKGTRGIPFPRALSRLGAAWVRRQFHREVVVVRLRQR